MELLQLRYFYTVGKTLNISQAAKIHYIPQPAMSKTISKLEQELGINLFTRERNHLALTPSGALFLESVESILTELDGCLYRLEEKRKDFAGEIKLLIMQHRSTMTDIITDFTKKHPNITFQISYNYDPKMSYDICIAEKDIHGRFDTSLMLVRERINLLVPKSHRLASQTTASIADIKYENFIFLNHNNAWLSDQLREQCNKQGVFPKVNIVYNDLFCIKKYLGSGLGIIFFPTVSWRHMLDDDVKEVLLDPPIYREVKLFWNSHKKIHEPSFLFVQETEAAFKRISSASNL